MHQKFDKEQIVYDTHNYGIDIKNGEIYLTGYINESSPEDPGVDYRSINSFIKNLRLLNSLGFKQILIHLNLGGGDWDFGRSAFDALEFSKARTTMICYSKAESMSGIIFQAAHTRLMMPNAYYLIHYGEISFSATSDEQVNQINSYYKNGYEWMIRTFAKRAISAPYFKNKKWDSEKVYKFFRNKITKNVDWILDSKESLRLGLIDGIIGINNYNL